MNSNIIKRSKVEKNYRNEAKYYFEDNKFDYYRSVKAYKEDLGHEVQLWAKEKESKRKMKGKKDKKVGEADSSDNGKCTIF
jgi:hypothetical protein